MENAPNMNILLLEDNELNAQIVKMYLKRSGKHVEWFDNGDEALECILNETCVFDLVLLDHQLEKESGDEWINRLRTEIPDFELPIISTSAHLETTEIEQNLKAGVAGFLQKPIMDKDLMRLEQHIQQTNEAWSVFREASKSEPISLENLNLGMLPKAKLVDFWLEYVLNRLFQWMQNSDLNSNECSGLLSLSKWCRFFSLCEAAHRLHNEPSENNKKALEFELNHCRECLTSLKAQMQA